MIDFKAKPFYLSDSKTAGGVHTDPEKAKEIVGCPEHKAYDREVADRSVTLVKNLENLIPINPAEKKRVLLYTRIREEAYMTNDKGVGKMFVDALTRAGFEVTEYQPLENGMPDMAAFADRYDEVTNKYDLIIYMADLITDTNSNSVRMTWTPMMGADAPIYIPTVPTVFISFANPYHLIDVPRVRTFINAYKAKQSTIDAVVDKLVGKSEFKGISPVDPFCGRWDTRL